MSTGIYPLSLHDALPISERMARRYHDHPALALWHVSNEYACHNLPCYCDRCAEAFRRWLTERYGDLDGLNHAWGTRSEEHTSELQSRLQLVCRLLLEKKK